VILQTPTKNEVFDSKRYFLGRLCNEGHMFQYVSKHFYPRWLTPTYAEGRRRHCAILRMRLAWNVSKQPERFLRP
jgi:hypothetical protein